MSEQARLRAPVVSVGNIAMGGRGKTPVTLLIARLLVAAGERPAILSRGYKRARPEDGVTLVSDGTRILADLDHSGDEPLMMAEAAPGAAVVVCDVRAMAGAFAEQQLGATVHILDDGFQHTSLARDIDIVIVAKEDLKGRQVPFGKLRSPTTSLRKADALILERTIGTSIGVAFDGHPNPPRCFHLNRMLGDPVAIDRSAPAPRTTAPVVAVAGIAEPDRFFAALENSGWDVRRTLKFRDHQAFARADVDRIATAAREAGAALVLTTEKDAVRLRPFAPFPVPFAAVPLTVTIQPRMADDVSFDAWLLQRVRHAREARA